MTRDEFPEVLKAFASDSRLAGATWDKIADTFPDPAKFTLVIMTPDGMEYWRDDRGVPPSAGWTLA
jgi:hypothetical protein